MQSLAQSSFAFNEPADPTPFDDEFRDAKPGPDDAPERWLPVPGWPNYDVSDWGRVRSYVSLPTATRNAVRCRERSSGITLIWGQIVTGGYRNVTLTRRLPDGTAESKPIGVQVLVLEAFVGPRPHGMEACHGPDHNPRNNRLGNLDWGSRRENARDALRQKRRKSAKLSESDIPVIWDRLRDGETSAAIARDYGVKANTISVIKTGHTWSHITSELPGWPLVPQDRNDREPVRVPEEIAFAKEEIWRPVPNWPALRVSNFGRIQSCLKMVSGPDGRFIGSRLSDEWHDRKACPNESGHLMIGMSLEPGRSTVVYVHNCVLEAFAGPRPYGMLGCHDDDNPLNCHAANLRWDTNRANQLDRFKHSFEASTLAEQYQQLGSWGAVAKANGITRARLTSVRKNLGMMARPQ